MLKQNKIKKEVLIFFLIGFVFLFLNIVQVKATEIQWPSVGGLTITDSTTLPQLVKYLFNFAIGLGGVLAFCMLVWGGFRYLISVGNPAAQKDARDTLTSAILGLLLLLTSYLLLQIINPDILILKPLSF